MLSSLGEARQGQQYRMVETEPQQDRIAGRPVCLVIQAVVVPSLGSTESIEEK